MSAHREPANEAPSEMVPAVTGMVRPAYQPTIIVLAVAGTLAVGCIGALMATGTSANDFVELHAKQAMEKAMSDQALVNQNLQRSIDDHGKAIDAIAKQSQETHDAVIRIEGKINEMAAQPRRR